MSAASADNLIARADTMRELQRVMLKSSSASITQQTVPSDLPSLNALLPDGGFSTASLVEWVSDLPGLAATTIALHCVRPFLVQPGCLAVVDGHHEFYQLAARSAGIAFSRMLLIRPAGVSGRISGGGAGRLGSATAGSQQADMLWSLEQAARCPGVRVVLCWLDRVSATVLRRLQLAVERSGVTVFMMRPPSVLNQPSWADLRLRVSAVTQSCQMAGSRLSEGSETDGQRLLSVRLLKSRQTVVEKQQRALLKIDDETGAVSAISELADPATAATAVV